MVSQCNNHPGSDVPNDNNSGNCSGSNDNNSGNCSGYDDNSGNTSGPINEPEKPCCDAFCYTAPPIDIENNLNCSNTCIQLNKFPYSTSFDTIAIQRRIQNQSRASEGRYQDNLNAVTVASNYLNFTGNRTNILKKSTLQWGKSFNLRNQSDQVLPSRSKSIFKNQFTINVPSRGNSVKSTTTANRPGASTPGGEGVDVKHGSYQRYLDKKKGKILSLANPSLDDEKQLEWYRQSPLSKNCSSKVQCGKLTNPASINNLTFKFSLISLNGNTCKDKNTCIL